MMDENKKSIKEQLAKSVREKGTTKCPKCASLVEWEDAEQYNPDGSKDRYFWCSNDTCELHQRDVVKVSISKGFLQTFQQNFSKIGKGMIGALFGALSVWGYGLMNGDDKTDDNSKEIAAAIAEKKDENEALVFTIEKLEKQIEVLENKGTTPPPIAASNNNSDSQQFIDSLEKVIRLRDERITNLESRPKQSALKLEEEMGLGMYYSNKDNKSYDLTMAKKYLFATLEKPKNNLGDKNGIVVRRLVNLRMNPRMKLDEYTRVIKYIKYLPGEEQNIAKAQVYWHYADASSSDYGKYKKYKLLSLKYYLESARMDALHGQDKEDAKILIGGLQNQHDSELSPLSTFHYPSDSNYGIIDILNNPAAIRKFLDLSIMKNLDS